MEDKTVIEIKNLTMQRTQKTLLDDANLSIQEGDIVFLIGINGCGKSTLLSLFRKVRKVKKRAAKKDKSSDTPVFDGQFIVSCGGQSHNIAAGGFELSENSEFYYRHIAYLDQTDLCEGWAPIKRTISAPTEGAIDELYKRKKKDKEKGDLLACLEKTVEDCIKKFTENSVVNMHRKRAKDLSGGQKRFISFCRTYVMAKVLGSSILVLDEPLNHLACEYKKLVDQMLYELVEQRRNEGNPLTLIIVSHCLPFRIIDDPRCRQVSFRNGKLEEGAKKERQHCLDDV